MAVSGLRRTIRTKRGLSEVLRKKKRDPFVPFLAEGKYLDNIAYQYGIKRKRRFLIFRENDDSLRDRVAEVVKSGFIE